jgi:uncharacterized protein (TIRG00374 family)
MSLLGRVHSSVAARPAVRVLLQATVSLVLIALLLGVAQRTDLVASLQLLQPGAIALAVSLYLAIFVFNSRRWQVLLGFVGIRERLDRLTALYLIGQFFSMFLPTTVGGDAVRVYEVARRCRRTTEAFVATLQERLLNLGAALFIGLVATLYYLPVIPAYVRLWIVLTQVGAMACLGMLLYPAILFRLSSQVWRSSGNRPVLGRSGGHPFIARAVRVLRTVAESPSLTPLQFLTAFGTAGAAVLLSIAMVYIVARSLQLPTGFLQFCLIVPLVWTVRMLPVSLNGVGVGEGAFVFLLGLFEVPRDPALALALVILGLQTTAGLLGGLMLAFRMARCAWAAGRRSDETNPAGAEKSASPCQVGTSMQPVGVARVDEDTQPNRRLWQIFADIQGSRNTPTEEPSGESP